MNEASASELYAVRPATSSDARFIYELSMDPRIRCASTRSTEFTFEEHRDWYAEKLGNPATRIWIMEVHGIRVGQIRYGRVQGRSDAEIAIAIVPAEWGNGYARVLLEETMPLARVLLRVEILIALVLVENVRSRQLFRAAGFLFERLEERMGKMHARYERVR